MRSIFILAISLVFFVSVNAATTCQSTINKETNPFCNTTALQVNLPAKACVAAGTPDFNIYCSQSFFDAWKNACPKQNKDAEGFCTGSSGSTSGYFCLLKGCNSDSDCEFPPASPTSQKPCYDCCQVCQEDSYCDSNSGDGRVYAAKGDSNCNSCLPISPDSPTSEPAANEVPAPLSIPSPLPIANWTGQVTVTITIVLKVGPSFVSVKQLAAELVALLNIPQEAIQTINVDYDRSNNERTVVVFVIQNVKLEDGSSVDPIEVASQLRQLVASKDRRISESKLLRDMEVEATDVPTAVPVAPNSSGYRNLISFSLVFVLSISM